MKIGFLAPSKTEEFICRLGITSGFYKQSIAKIAKYLAGKHEIVLTPEKGSVSECLAEEYKKFGGKKVIGIIPKDDKTFGIANLNPDVCDEIINCGTWADQPGRLDTESDSLLVFGLTPGVFIEISYTKWFKVDNIFILKEFIIEELPAELEKLNATYITLDELNKV